MRLLSVIPVLLAVIVVAGCSSAGNQLNSAGQHVRFVDQQPGAECHYIGTASGEQSNWFSGQQVEGGNSLRGAANNLRNRAAEMGGNVIYNASTPGLSLVSSFVPVATKMSGQVYNCP
ncbi:DUF4156 domain-containing protein [Tatumella sp. TA1]|uniref:DUF4156 domain-containing protein n=1 Tax=Rosenbergiella collisarenosi TaxID=1544695 RepID=UPI0008F7E7BE|nr:DUF4156 domain-containing protein [Rosenbergiella collisarenosi]MBT0719934.1 DUF4156 domain-containing protein [Rosenbergiella collisarenosi]QGX90548.1 DUF4156 domain-containing protein [Tatumella sp. TA1]